MDCVPHGRLVRAKCGLVRQDRHRVLSLRAYVQEHSTSKHRLSFERTTDGTFVIRLAGAWRMRHGMPSATEVERELAVGDAPRQVAFEASGLTGWDSSLLSFVIGVIDLCNRRGVTADRSTLPPGLKRLVELAESVPEKKDPRRGAARGSISERVGRAVIGIGESCREALEFLGEVTLALRNVARRNARFRSRICSR